MFIKTGRLLAVAAITLTAMPAFARDLRYAHVGAEGDIQTRYAAEAAEEIAAATDGAVTVQVFPASQLGGVSEMVGGVQMGSIQMGHHDFASLAQMVPDVSVFNAPFIYRNGDHALAATNPATSPPCRRSTSSWSSRAACGSSGASIAARAISRRTSR
ncbi:TRAP transporter substrate-binding protein DctP [Paracoccus marcusii]|uniref:TRAP transporter substrate-binding protein DctP n=1 Tax=Paracoccus marcusii TaxID=59779 RepID=UPI002ED4CD89|nr:TRAP transporter substrate-binding protein DctP [Paracoccus marcusii]